jgi:hypothetical protein
MKFVEPSRLTDPDAAARKLVEIANATEPPQDGRIYIELVTTRRSRGPLTGGLGTCVLRRVVYAASLRVRKAARDQAEIEVECTYGKQPQTYRLADEAHSSNYNSAEAKSG